MDRSSFGALAAAVEFDISCGDICGAPRGEYGRCFQKKKEGKQRDLRMRVTWRSKQPTVYIHKEYRVKLASGWATTTTLGLYSEK